MTQTLLIKNCLLHAHMGPIDPVRHQKWTPSPEITVWSTQLNLF